MEIAILFGSFAALLLMGVPVAFCLGLSSLATVLYMGIPPIVVFQQMSTGMNAFAM
ncbi:MAG: TRAP transporter large permease, partial [Rhabdaerophilum sp.]